MTDYTILPTRTDYSLGRVKTDPESAIALDHQVAAAEWETSADWVEECARIIGREGSEATGATSGTVRGIHRRIGYGDPMMYRWLDHFEYRGAANTFDPRWNMAINTTCLDVFGGVATFRQDLALAEDNYQHGRFYERAAFPVLEARVSQNIVDATAPLIRLGFVNSATGTDGFGITFERGVSLKWQVFSLVGGNMNYAEIGTANVALGTWYILRVWLEYIGGNYYARASVDGTNDTTETVGAIASVPMTAWIRTGTGTAAGNFWGCDYTWIEAGLV